MNFWINASDRLRTAILVGVAVALLGPLIASIGVIGVGYLSWADGKSVFREFPLKIYFVYTLLAGIIPAIFAGIWAGIEIVRTGWISLLKMFVMAIAISAIPALGIAGIERKISTLPENFMIFFVPTVFVTIALRVLIMACGLVRRPS